MPETTEVLKQEISEAYLKNFKKELGWLKSLTLLPIEKKIKNILVWRINLPSKFDEIKEFWWRRNIINFFSPSTGASIYKFIKEKSSEIEKRKTASELLELKNSIILEGQTGTETQPENSTETQPENSTETQPENSTETQPESSTETQPENSTETQPESSTETQPESSTETQPENSTETQPENSTETQPENSTETQPDKESSSISIWTRFALYGSAWVYWLWKISNNIDRTLIKDSLDAWKIRETINWAIAQMKHQKDVLGKRLTKSQIKTIDKHIKKMEEWLQLPDSELSEILKERNKVWKKIPWKLLESSWLSVKEINIIQDLAWELHGKSITEIKSILSKNWINNVWEELLLTIKQAKTVDEIKSIAKVLRHWSKLNRIIQTMCWAMLVDVAFLWLDVRMFIEQRKEAELIAKVNKIRSNNKYLQAYTQLWIWISSVVLEAVWTICACASSWSVWGPYWVLIWLVIWVATTVTSIWVDAYYFDVVDFYTQNRDDFLRQKKSRITEAILQWLHNEKKWNTSTNEIIWSLWVDSWKRKDSTEAALRSLMFLDELDSGEFRNYAPFHEYLGEWITKEDYLKKVTKWLSGEEAKEVRANFEEYWTKMNNKIEIRMKYLEEILKKDDVINSLKTWNWIQTINELCLESRIYAQIWQEKRQWDKSRESYKFNLNNYKKDFFKDFSPEKITKLENLKKTEPTLFQEMISSSGYESLLDEDENDPNYSENIKLIQKYKERIELTQINADKIWLSIEDTNRNMRFIESLVKSDFDLNWISIFEWYSDEEVINLINSKAERRWACMEVSDDVWQNVLYRLAKELYNYDWENSKKWIMSFFDEWNDWVHGIYYGNKWKINADRAKDSVVGKDWMDKIFSSEDEVTKYVNDFIKNNFSTVFWVIDTATESIDDDLEDEVKTVFRKILTQELMRRTKNNQEKVKNEIIDFVKKYSNWNYLELPYYLVLKARRAWLWNLERQFIKCEWGSLSKSINSKIVVLNLPTEISNNPLWAEVNYITKARESYTDEEKVYISMVEDARDKLTDLFAAQWGVWVIKQHESDLDLPREVKWLFSDKCKEWDEFKERLLLYSPDVVSGMLEEYNQYTEYFENLYRWILLALTTYKVSNDIDTYGLFQQAEWFWNLNYFWENWEIKTDLDIDFFKNTEIKSFYNSQIKSQKVKFLTYEWNEKEATIEELRKSQEEQEKQIAKRASNLIIMTIAEQWRINRGSSWEITWICIWDNRKDSYTRWVKELKNETESLISNRLKNIKWRLLIDKTKIKTKKQEVRALTKKESKTSEEMVDLQKEIENTAKDIEWQDKRWDIKYDPEKKTLKSRSQSVKIDLVEKWKYKIKGLDIEFTDLKEMLWVANFRNRAVKTYPNEVIEYDWDLANTKWSRRNTLVVDRSVFESDTMLIPRWALEEYYPACKDDNVVKKLAKRLNSEVWYPKKS